MRGSPDHALQGGIRGQNRLAERDAVTAVIGDQGGDRRRVTVDHVEIIADHHAGQQPPVFQRLEPQPAVKGYQQVGRSQVRESAIFSGIQITERLAEAERTCGVWVVDIQRGQVVAFLKFEEAVQEIFAVCLLPGMRFPDLINDSAELIGSSFVLPDEALREVPAELLANG